MERSEGKSPAAAMRRPILPESQRSRPSRTGEAQRQPAAEPSWTSSAQAALVRFPCRESSTAPLCLLSPQSL